MGITDNIQGTNDNQSNQNGNDKMTTEEWMEAKRREESEMFRIAKYIEAPDVPTQTFTVISSALLIEANRDTSNPTGLGGEPLDRLKTIMADLHKEKYTFRASTFVGKLGEAVFLKGGFNNEVYVPFAGFTFAHGNDTMGEEERVARTNEAEEMLSNSTIHSEPTIDALQHTTKQFVSKWKKTSDDFVKANRMYRSFLSMVPFLTFGANSDKKLGLCLYYSEVGDYSTDYKEVNSAYEKLAENAKQDGVINENAKGYSIDNVKSMLDTVKNIAYDGVTCINLYNEDCVEAVKEVIALNEKFAPKASF